TIDIGELAIFMPVIIPNASPYTLLHHIQKADQSNLKFYHNLFSKSH
ncbi:unnamed protein product, partial [Adineta steineri]